MYVYINVLNEKNQYIYIDIYVYITVLNEKLHSQNRIFDRHSPDTQDVVDLSQLR